MTDLLINFDIIQHRLEKILHSAPKLVIMGIGENRMGDDGIGPWIAYNLYQIHWNSKIRIINAGILPEQRIQELISFNPQILLLIDAIQTAGNPGTVNIYDRKQMVNYLPISTHTLPLPLFLDRIDQTFPEIKSYLLGISPFHLDFEDHYVLFDESQLNLEDENSDPNIPFYRFNLSPSMRTIGDQLIIRLKELLVTRYS